MEPNEIHQTIAGQLDHMKPDDLKPGVDVGMEATSEDTLAVIVVPTGTRATVRYDAGRDTYAVSVVRGDDDRFYDDVYCDQLGELIFGDEAKPFTAPMVQISTDDGETWDVIA
jgi:hypothetical protein